MTIIILWLVNENQLTMRKFDLYCVRLRITITIHNGIDHFNATLSTYIKQ